VQSVLFATSRINTSVTPRSDDVIPGLDPTDTTRDGHRHDYVLPSRNVGIAAAGIWRLAPTSEASGEAVPFPAEHFPVWMDLWIPDPPGGR
jgi:hypothetical protein